MLKPQRFMINKKSDYLRGFGGDPGDDKLTLKNDGCYFSEVFDSGEKGTRWYKLESLYKLPVNCSVKITFFTTDEPEILIGGKKYELISVIRSNNSPDKKIKAFSESFRSVSHDTARELLITELKGRYLFFAIQSVSSDPGSGFPEIYEMRLSFSPSMLTGLLPEIYRDEENSFLERYLAIFQSLYESMDEKIEHAAESYTPENPDRDFLRWLSDIIGIKTADLWTEEQLRYILKNASRIFGMTGTKTVILELCGLYLGCTVEIIEYYDREQGNFNKYGLPADKLFIDPYTFTLIVRKERLSSAELDGLQRVIDACKPAHMSANILTLPGGGTYKDESRLGENTVLFDDGITLV